MTDKKESSMLKSMLKYALALSIGIVVGGVSEALNSNKIPKTEEVQQGYVVPNKLEVVLSDLDGNGQKEVLMKYNRKSYLLRLDEQGKPRVQDYDTKSAEIIPKE